MRGKETGTSMKQQDQRITPAYAGKSRAAHHFTAAGQDHPRLCGEKVQNVLKSIMFKGSPPPMRGKGEDETIAAEDDRITPAYAGKSFD